MVPINFVIFFYIKTLSENSSHKFYLGPTLTSTTTTEKKTVEINQVS